MRPGALQRDVGREWLSTVRAAGIKTGVYYSLGENFFLNRHSYKKKEKKPLPGQVDVSDAEFAAFAVAQLEEIWCTMGPMHELW